MSVFRVRIGPVPPDTMTGTVPVRIDIWPRSPKELAEQLERDAKPAERIGLHEPITCGTLR